MKKVRKLPLLLFAALILLLAACVMGLTACDGEGDEHSYTDPLYKFDITKYDVEYDINKNCSMSVTETITVFYQGWESTGFIRDIPVNSGTQVKNVKVYKLAGSSPSFYYNVFFENNNFVSVDIGDHSNKRNKSETYKLTYDYVITNKVVNKSSLPLNPIGFGWDCTISDVSIRLILPDGFESAKCYVGEKGTKYTYAFNQSVENGRTVLATHIDNLYAFQGVTFNMQFKKGAIGNYVDFTPFWFVLVGALLVAGVVLLKVFVFNKSYLMPVVNYEAPNKMDPLLMGKLIDNKVDSEDITSLIYYWANKGYLKINLDNKDDPTLIRIVQRLPNSCSAYENTLFQGLFERGDDVRSSELTNRYYKYVERATGQINAKAKGLYKKNSIALSFTFAGIAGLIMGLAPLLLAFFRISHTLIYFLGLIAVIPAIIVNVFAQALQMYKFKLKKSKYVALWCLIGLVCVIVSCVYLAIPSAIIGMTAKFLIGLVCMGTAACSAILLTRTQKYTEQLNDILGFKNFIQLAEKDQLETLLEDNPQFYYYVLPYAQVLGVTDKWQEKFENITLEPPKWASGDLFTTYIEFRILNSLIGGAFRGMAKQLISKPSSSGKGGFHGSFGGFGGGGFGGGGGRGR